MKVSQRTITEKCPVDGQAHIFVPIPDQAPWVYCQKCLTVMQVEIGSPNPEPPPNQDTKVYQANGSDDTDSLQNWINQQSNDAVYDIQGWAAINERGVNFNGKTNIIVTSSNGGGFRAIGNNLYSSPFATMVYAENFNFSEFNGLKFDCNNKQAMGVFLCKCESAKVVGCEVYKVKMHPNGAPWAGIYGEQCVETEIANNNVHDMDVEIRGIWLGVGDRLDTYPYIHHNTVSRTGHTGIVTESNGPYVHDNKVYNAGGGGSGYKFIPRGDTETTWENNQVDTTANSGFMIEASNINPKINIRGWLFKNCGAQGTSFGGLYFVGGAGNRHIHVSGCTFENCRRMGAMQMTSSSDFADMIVKSGSNVWALEQDNNDLQFNNAGVVELGNGNYSIHVDGKQVA